MTVTSAVLGVAYLTHVIHTYIASSIIVRYSKPMPKMSKLYPHSLKQFWISKFGKMIKVDTFLAVGHRNNLFGGLGLCLGSGLGLGSVLGLLL